MAPPSVFVVDDQPSFRRAARAVIAAAGCTHGGEAASADAAMKSLTTPDPPPDLVLIDVNLGPESGIELTRDLIARRPGLRIVLVSTMAEIDLPSDAATAGAAGFVEKSRLDPKVVRDLVASTPTHGV